MKVTHETRWPQELVNQVVCGNCMAVMSAIPSQVINAVICSPPYYRQRCYSADGVGEIGQEQSLEEYLASLLVVFEECVRVTRDDGNIIFNLGDKSIDGGLQLLPHRFALLATGLGHVKLANHVLWVKPNPTPRPGQRRLVPSTEPFFHFVKSKAHYFDDGSEVMVPRRELRRSTRAN
jgi:DNA modification methylase